MFSAVYWNLIPVRDDEWQMKEDQGDEAGRVRLTYGRKSRWIITGRF